MRILIVEDEVMIREGLAKLIRAHTDHAVIGEASNGKEGLQLAIRYRPDLMITDIRMPVMDGLEMIEALHGMGLRIRAVILSGYSEFAYAKRAIYFGVEDYLLKPLAAEDIVEALQRIEEKIEAEEKKYAGTPVRYIRELIDGGALQQEGRQCLAQDCGFGSAGCFQIYLGYLGETLVGYEEEIRGKWETLKNDFTKVRLFAIANGRKQQLLYLAVLPPEEGAPALFQKAVERRITRPYKQKENRGVWSMAAAARWEEIPEAARAAESLLREAMGVRDGELILRERLQALAWKEFQYPAELGAEMKHALCRGEPDAIRAAGERFIGYMQDGPLREQEIRQAYLKAVYLLLDTVREVDGDTYGRMQNADLLAKCTEAVTLREMSGSFRDGLDILCSSRRVREDISNYTIKRAINHIREHYQEGITLEEVSGQLGITPEYLSTLFNREMKVNFSTFLRQFRISHAKRLLKGTDMKVYEVAEAVGYSDSKYFARVFKEELGVSPGDYRQME